MRDSERTRRRILRAAQKLFSTHGYVDTGLREITDLAGVNVALVNHYFGSKEALFEAALADLLSPGFLTASREDFGERVLNALMLERRDKGIGPLPMLIFATADPGARAIAMRLLNELVAAPLTEWLQEKHAEQRAAHILAITAGFTIYRHLFPMDAYQDPISAEARNFLTAMLQSLADGRSAP